MQSTRIQHTLAFVQHKHTSHEESASDAPWVITPWENAEQVAFLLILVFLRPLLIPGDQKP
jgi:hypothetical protein